MEVGAQCHALAALLLGKGLVPIVHEAGWASGPVWTGMEKRKSIGLQWGLNPKLSSL
jgi:hypothetical protein